MHSVSKKSLFVPHSTVSHQDCILRQAGSRPRQVSSAPGMRPALLGTRAAALVARGPQRTDQRFDAHGSLGLK